jgi:phosphohistidine phosphatase
MSKFVILSSSFILHPSSFILHPMLLFIIRHAWAGQFGDPDWPDDAERPLTAEGKKRFAAVVKAIAGREFCPELVVTSPLVRCRQTAELVAKGVKGTPKLVQRDELQPGSNLDALIAWTASEAADRRQIAWVGHNPDVEEMTAVLIGAPAAHLRFAKGAVAALEFPGLPRRGEGELRWLVTARVLGVRE